jgi:hypothetical protein
MSRTHVWLLAVQAREVSGPRSDRVSELRGRARMRADVDQRWMRRSGNPWILVECRKSSVDFVKSFSFFVVYRYSMGRSFFVGCSTVWIQEPNL